jgi:negative regulator of flagellin synthesis FlgM
MKVGQQQGPAPKVSTPPKQAGGSATPAKSGAAATATTSATSGGVAVKMSTTARELEQASRKEAGSDVNMEKVKAVRDAIDNGTYQVNAEAIADKLLSNAQEMLDRTRD